MGKVAIVATLTSSASLARAAPRASCADGRISLEGELDARWIEPVQNLCTLFTTLRDVEPSATMRISGAADNLELEVTLGGSRTARRTLRSPDDLLTTVEALTIAIPAERPVKTPGTLPSANVSSLPERGASSAGAQPIREHRTKAGASVRMPSLEVELGVALEGRLSGAPAYVSLGGAAYAGLRPDDWFFGVVARWQPSEVPASGLHPGFEMESAGAGFVVARRVLNKRVLGLDAGGTALVLVDTQSIEGRTPDEVGASTGVRFGALVRALVGASPWKLSTSLDADLAPSRLRQNSRLEPALPLLPTWSVALALGATWVGR